MRSLCRFLALAAIPAVMTGCSGDEAPSEQRATQAEPSGAAPTQIVVRLELANSAGEQVAGVLYDVADLQPVQMSDAVGGFSVAVDADPFTGRAVVTLAGKIGTGDFPYVTDEPYLAEPGGYTLLLWRSPDLGPYSRWVPAAETDLELCVLPFEVQGDSPTTGHDAWLPGGEPAP